MAAYSYILGAGQDRFCCVNYSPEKMTWVYTKAFLKFPLAAALFGQTALAASLSVYTTGGTASMSARAYTTYGAWDGTTTAVAMDNLYVGSQAWDLKPVASAGSWTTFSVLGNASGGIVEALASSRPYITVVLMYDANTAPAELRAETLNLGANIASPNDIHNFDYPGNPSDGTHLPFLSLVTEGGGQRYAVPGVAVGGLFY